MTVAILGFYPRCGICADLIFRHERVMARMLMQIPLPPPFNPSCLLSTKSHSQSSASAGLQLSLLTSRLLLSGPRAVISRCLSSSVISTITPGRLLPLCIHRPTSSAATTPAARLKPTQSTPIPYTPDRDHTCSESAIGTGAEQTDPGCFLGQGRTLA